MGTWWLASPLLGLLCWSGHYQDRYGANGRIEAVMVIGVAEHTVKACTVDDGVNTGDTEGGGVAAVVAAVV